MTRQHGALTTTVEYAVAPTVAFAYLADPRNRPQWQSSLKDVEMLDEGDPRHGMRWRDLTAAGIAPEMVITEMRPHELWSETGTWRAFSADLSLRFSPRGSGCTVEATFGVRARGLLRPAGWVATRAGLFAVRSDLRRAGRLLAQGDG